MKKNEGSFVKFGPAVLEAFIGTNFGIFGEKDGKNGKSGGHVVKVLKSYKS